MGDDGKRDEGKGSVDFSGKFRDSPIIVGDHGRQTIIQQAAAQPQLEPRHNNLPPRNHDFVGREDELQRIHDLLSQGTAVALKPASVSGMGGVGKTQLAIEYAHRRKEEFDHICWVDAEGEDIVPAMARLASSPLALPLPADAKTADVHNAVLARLEREGCHLLILDNVDHPTAWRKAVPTSGQVRLLITTRRSRLPAAETVEVEVLPRADALRLLRGPDPLLEQEEAHANSLCEELGDLALAIAVAGKLLESPFSSPGALRSEIDKQGPVAWSEGQEHIAEELEKHPSLEKLFLTSIEQLDERGPVDALALAVFKVAGWLAPIEIESRILVDISPGSGEPDHEAQVYKALQRLESLGLIRTGPMGGAILHRLLHEFARLMGGRDVQRAVNGRLEQYVTDVSSDSVDLLTLRPLRGHLLEATNHRESHSEEPQPWISLRLAQLSYILAEYALSLQLLETLIHRPLPPAILIEATESYGRILNRFGRYAEALVRFKQLRVLIVNSNVRTDVSHSGALRWIGRVQLRLGNTDSALVTFLEAQAVAEAATPPSSRDVADSLAKVASTLHRKGHYLDAVAYYDRALHIARQVHATLHPSIATMLNGKAKALHRLGEFNRARDCYEQAITIIDTVWGHNHPDSLISRNGIGRVLLDLGMYSDALDRFQLVKEARVQALGPTHPEVSISLNAMGEALAGQGRHEAALDLYERAHAIKIQTFGPTHFYTAITWTMRGRSQTALGELASAADSLAKAQKIMLGSQGPWHPFNVLMRCSMARLLFHQGEFRKGRLECVRGLRISRRAFTPNHPQFVEPLLLAAQAEIQLRLFDAAKAHIQRAEQIIVDAFGDRHPYEEDLRQLQDGFR